MALDQNRYIRIDSNVNNTATGSRDFSGLVFSKYEMVSGATDKTAYDAGNVLAYDSDGIGTAFGATSDMAKFANKYFAYIARSGATPSKLKVVKVLAGETPEGALIRVNSNSGNFGAFTFLGSVGNTGADFTLAQLRAVGLKNASYNCRYLYCAGCTVSDVANYYNATTGLGGISGTFIGQGYAYTGDAALPNGYFAALPMAIVACIDWTGRNTTVDFMFKQWTGETPSVTTSSVADTLDAAHVNYYGRAQFNGQTKDFLQRGFNADGYPTAPYVNEMWLKAAIAERYITLATTVDKIPANDDGAAMILAQVMSVVTDAIENGTIEAGKTLDSTDRAYIYSLTSDDNAADKVATDGYWINIVIEKYTESGTTEYKAVYRLVYGKGDAIHFVQGYHNLI